jgi:DNA-binding transcriptional MerR regulator
MTVEVEQLLTVGGLAALLGMREQTVRHWARKGWISCDRDSSGRRLFDAISVQEARAFRDERAKRRKKINKG